MSNARSRRSGITTIGVLAVALTGSAVGLADTADRAPKPRAKPQINEQMPPPAIVSKLLTIVPRRDWRAKPPLFDMQGHVPLSIMLHHTAGPVNTKRDIVFKMRSLQAYSQKPATLGNGRKRAAWADVPYHYYISADGAVAEGRDVRYSGDTNTDYDTTGHIQVVLEGNFEEIKPTGDQLAALETLVVELAKEWKLPATQIRTHKQVAATLCPGRNFMDIYPALQQRIAERLK